MYKKGITTLQCISRYKYLQGMSNGAYLQSNHKLHFILFPVWCNWCSDSLISYRGIKSPTAPDWSQRTTVTLCA